MSKKTPHHKAGHAAARPAPRPAPRHPQAQPPAPTPPSALTSILTAQQEAADTPIKEPGHGWQRVTSSTPPPTDLPVLVWVSEQTGPRWGRHDFGVAKVDTAHPTDPPEFFLITRGMISRQVTHWQPLPQPPEA